MINLHDTKKNWTTHVITKKYKSVTDIPDSQLRKHLFSVQAAVITSSLQTKKLQLSWVSFRVFNSTTFKVSKLHLDDISYLFEKGAFSVTIYSSSSAMDYFWKSCFSLNFSDAYRNFIIFF